MLRRLQLTALHRSYSTFDTISSRSAAFIKEISSRGLIYQHSNGLSIDPTLCDPIEGVYMGIDPTAPSLHIGHLLGIMSILHANRLGKNHAKIAVKCKNRE